MAAAAPPPPASPPAAVVEVKDVAISDPQKEPAKADDDLSDVPYGTRLAEVAKAFLPMGFIAFGGPQAHIALFLKTFVEGKKWLDEQRFMELMSLGQAMPGPTNS